MSNIVTHTVVDDNDGQRWYKHFTLILCGMNATGDVEGLARGRRASDALVRLGADRWLNRALTTATRAR